MPAEVIELAVAQGGAIGTFQIARNGADRDRIYRWVAKGWLVPERRGVLRFGALTRDGEYWAAALALGEASTITHLSGAWLRGFVNEEPALIHVTHPKRRKDRAGMQIHQARLCPEYEIGNVRKIPVASTSRILLDVAATEPEDVLQEVIDGARARSKIRQRAINETIKRAPGHHGIKPLLNALAKGDPGTGRTRSPFEDLAIPFLRDHGFPPYRRNHLIRIDDDVYMPDVVWPQFRFWLELDGRSVHDNERAFDEDTRKRRRLQAKGWPGIPATYKHLTETPDELAADLWESLEARGARRAA